MASLAEALRVVVILDAAAARGRPLGHIAAAAAEGGATMLQVRSKGAGAGELAALAREVRDAAASLPVIVNDRLDVALATSAAGCHLGQDDFPIAAARSLIPAGFILGASAGSAAEARAALAAGAHYIGAGPVNATGTKDDAGPATGVPGFAAIRAAAPGLPVVAIGGVSVGDVPLLIGAGAAGVAVVGAVLGADDPVGATRALREAVDTALRKSGA
jgi:thiamine-phosphate pyrophosphorylase